MIAVAILVALLMYALCAARLTDKADYSIDDGTKEDIAIILTVDNRQGNRV